MSTVIKRKNSITNEIVISGLHSPYSVLYQEDGKATLDIYLKIGHATKLLKDLKEVLENKVDSPSIDR